MTKISESYQTPVYFNPEPLPQCAHDLSGQDAKLGRALQAFGPDTAAAVRRIYHLEPAAPNADAALGRALQQHLPLAAKALLQQLASAEPKPARIASSATRASGESQRRARVARLVRGTMTELFREIRPEVAKFTPGLLSRVSASSKPVSAVWTMLRGLATVGNANHSPDIVGWGGHIEKAKGFAETLGAALENPRLRQTSLSRLSASRPGLGDDEFAEKYRRGARLAARLVDNLTTAERRQLAQKLAKDIGDYGPGTQLATVFDERWSAARLTSWIGL